MKFVRALFVLALLTFVHFALAQTPPPKNPETDKEKAQAELKQKAVALINSTANDAAFLKLPENRASVYAEAATLIWQADEKRARSLFRRAAEELNLLQTEIEDEDLSEEMHGFINLRKRVLRLAARHDADLALKLMQETRPAEVAAAMSLETPATQIPVSEDSKSELKAVILKQQVVMERQLESSLIAASVESNPRRAAQLLRENINAGVSPALLQSLQKLREKDAETASQIANDALRKLIANPPSANPFENHFSDYFLIYFANPNAAKKAKPLQIDETLVRQLAVKTAEYYLQADDKTESGYLLGTIQPTLERLVPERTVQKLREKRDAWRKTLPPEEQEYLQLAQYRRADVTVEKMLADADKMPTSQRNALYHQAANKLIQAKDYARARQILQTKLSAKENAGMLDWVSMLEIDELVAKDKFEAAQESWANIKDKNTRVRMTVSIAKALAAKNTTESRTKALKLLDEARKIIDVTPESEDEIEPFLQLVGGYVALEPETAFKMIQPVILTINDLMNAGALVRKFVKNKQEFRQGEFILGIANPEFRRFFAAYQKDLGALARYDFDRTNKLADKFTRPESQISLRLLIANSILREKTEVEENFFQITNENGSMVRIGIDER